LSANERDASLIGAWVMAQLKDPKQGQCCGPGWHTACHAGWHAMMAANCWPIS